MSIPKTYFHRLWSHNKKIFWGVSIFTFFTLFFNLTGDEVSPFFVWGMFSEKFPRLETREIVTFKINGEDYNYHRKLSNINGNMLASPVYYYSRMVKNNDEDPTRTFFREKTGKRFSTIEPLLTQVTNDPAVYPEFKDWVKRYIEKSSGQEVDELEVSIATYRFNEANVWEPISEETLFKQ